MRPIAVTASILSLLGGSALAQGGLPTEPWDLRKAQAFSNMCLSQETGDARGLRVFIQAPGAKPLIVTQVAEGAPMAPQAATAASVAGTAVRFTTAGGEVYRGTLSDKALTLSSQRLPRLVLHRRSDATGFPGVHGRGGPVMIRGLLLSVALLAAGAAQAQAPGAPKPPNARFVAYANDPHWVVDPLSKCAVYNTRPDPAITVRWAGACVNGMADGRGTVVYSRNNRFAAKYDGGMSGGARNGREVYYAANFDQLSVNCKDGLAEGSGEWTYGDRSRFTVVFHRGEARGEGRYYVGDWEYIGALNGEGRAYYLGGSPRPARLAYVPFQQPRLQNPDGTPFGF